MIGFGIPINEFSFGNTLILAGTVSIVGGVIVAGLGAAVSQLQKVADALATRVPARPGRPPIAFEPPAGARPDAFPARVPFPPKPKVEPRPNFGVHEPPRFAPTDDAPTGMPLKDYPPDHFAPSLPNPDESPVTVDDDVSLSPRHPMAPTTPADPASPPPLGPSFEVDESELDEAPVEQPKADAGWRPPPPVAPVPARPKQSTYFDAMWPAGPKADPSKSAETQIFDPKSAEPETPEPTWDDTPPAGDNLPEPAFDQQADEPAPDDGPAAVAILKSGVVDGMGYTLYVDGSIEAELPQGTLRFASITELRTHLERTP
ncbi:MAG: hypothetical protein K9G60_01310 [Pseudolabrys sp.]|nr:hypothetical protein [Pseudolabrys sp.]